MKPDGTMPGIHALITGGTCRLLFRWAGTTGTRHGAGFWTGLSVGHDPAYSAAWLEGFLTGSGLILLYDHTLWNLLYKWGRRVATPPIQRAIANFTPNIRRFDPADRRHWAAKRSRAWWFEVGGRNSDAGVATFNSERAGQVLGVVRELFGSVNNQVILSRNGFLLKGGFQ